MEQDESLEVSLDLDGGPAGLPLLQPHGGPETEGRLVRPDLLQVEEVQGSAGHPHLQRGGGQAGSEGNHRAVDISEVR